MGSSYESKFVFSFVL